MIAFDLGQAVENAMLTAWELGIVQPCHGSVYDEPRIRALLAYPPEMTCDLVVSFGYPTDPASLAPPGSRGGRKRLGEFCGTRSASGADPSSGGTSGSRASGTVRLPRVVCMGQPGGGLPLTGRDGKRRRSVGSPLWKKAPLRALVLLPGPPPRRGGWSVPLLLSLVAAAYPLFLSRSEGELLEACDPSWTPNDHPVRGRHVLQRH